MKTQLFLVVFLCNLALSRCYLFFGGDGTSLDSPGDEAMHSVMSTLSQHLNQFLIEAVSQLVEPWEQSTILENIAHSKEMAKDSSANCQDCVSASTLFLELTDRGFTYEDLKPIAYEVCLVATEGVGWDGTLICDGILDNYGPHVMIAFNETIMSAEEICVLYNDCDPGEVPLPVYSTDPSKFRPYESSQRRNVSLNETIRVIHITDIHSEWEYQTGAATVCSMPSCCREWAGTNYTAQIWGNYGCNAPPRLVDLYFTFLASLNAEFILYTGDTPASTPYLETQWGQINQSQVIPSKLETYLPGKPAFSTIGNHDMYPTNIYYRPRQDTQEINQEFGKMWQGVSGFQQEQLDTLDTGGFYSTLIRPGLRVLSYNSNYVPTKNVYIILDQENNGYAAMRQFMEDTFNTARANAEKVVLLGHHMSGGGGLVTDYSEFITDICRRNADLIVLHLFGHSHKDKFTMNSDPVTGDVYDVQMSPGAVSTLQAQNPSVRLLYLHPDTFDLMDMDTYYLDLQDPINNTTDPEIRLGYRATEEYNLPDFTPTSVKNMIDRMATDVDLVAKYQFNYYTRTGFDEPCDAACMADLQCDMRYTSRLEKRSCKNSIN